MDLQDVKAMFREETVRLLTRVEQMEAAAATTTAAGSGDGGGRDAV
jgi:hypothetical protein